MLDVADLMDEWVKLHLSCGSGTEGGAWGPVVEAPERHPPSRIDDQKQRNFSVNSEEGIP